MTNVLRVIVVGLVALALQAGLAVAAVDTSNWQKVELTDGAVVTLKLPQDIKETGRKELDKGIWKYQFKNQDYRLALGFYPQDGGNYKGSSKDSSRYSGNFVTADDLNSGTDLEEKNMWIATAAKKINLNQDILFKLI